MSMRVLEAFAVTAAATILLVIVVGVPARLFDIQTTPVKWAVVLIVVTGGSVWAGRKR